MAETQYGMDFSNQNAWVNVGSLTVAQAALGVTELTETVVAALASTKKVLWIPDNGFVAAEVRFRVDGSNDDANVVEIYASRYGNSGAGNTGDHYRRVATLTMTAGTQTCGTLRFLDALTLSNNLWFSKITVQTTTNSMGTAYFNLYGYNRFLFIASTLNSTTLYVDIARLDHEV